MNDGKLTKEQEALIEVWFETKVKQIGRCPICSETDWTVLGHFVDLPIYRGGGTIGGDSYPNIGLTCANCGNTQLINAVVAGVLPTNPAPAISPQKGKGN